MRQVAYYLSSPNDPPIERQIQAHAGGPVFDREFMDFGVSRSVAAGQRPGWQSLIEAIAEGDTVHVQALDRLGRDARDVQGTLQLLLSVGAAVEIEGLGRVGKDAGKPILAVLGQLAALERQRSREPADAGRKAAKRALAATGATHRGKVSLGRPRAAEPVLVRAWRAEHGASLSQTARHFGISLATVKRAMKRADLPPAGS